MTVLGIDTSCDDSSVGIVRDGQVLANIVSSQDAIHREWGGVVPNLARRAHQENLPLVYEEALQSAKVLESEIDVIAVTQGPGLAVALEVGIQFAKDLSVRLNKPLVAVNHLEGHLLASLIGETPRFPVLAIIASGKHTELVRMSTFGSYELLGETVDDALGEAYDKVARLLGLGFPGGRPLAQLAESGNPKAFDLPTAMRQSGNLNVSYSGIKTAVYRLIEERTQGFTQELSQQDKQDIAASFQHAALKTLLIKVDTALEQESFVGIILGGGVAANTQLRSELQQRADRLSIPFFVPRDAKLCLDNGAMIAFAGEQVAQRGTFVENHELLDRKPRLELTSEL